MLRCQSQDRCRRPNFLASARHSCKLLCVGGKDTTTSGLLTLNTEASPSGVPSSLVHAGSANPLSVSDSSSGPHGESYALLAGRPRAVDPMGGRVGRGRVARLGAHRSRGWRRLQRAERLPGKLTVLGTDFGLGPGSAPGGPTRPPRVIRGLAGGR